LEACESQALIFTKVDRASRCTEDFARLIRVSEEQDWRLIVTEMGIDTRRPMGKAMAHMAVVFAELERQRTPRPRCLFSPGTGRQVV
jgi:DNA invertase Pin-like site-specific DNA recombinase